MPSIEDMAEPTLRVEVLALDDLEFDESNPNRMDDDMYDALVADIRDHGFTQPVAVWPLPAGRYRLIDGEHRVRALRDLAASQVPAVIVEAENEDDARLRLLTMNRLRGDFVPIKLAYLLADLQQRIPERELRKRLGMEAGEMKDLLRLAEFTDPLAERLKASVQREEKEAPTVLKFVLSPRDAAVVERVIDGVVDEKVDRGKALATVCRGFERAKKA